MPYYKFDEDDVYFNRIKTHPSCVFYIYSGSVYYNNEYTLSGAFTDSVRNMPPGHISLHEMNVDRTAGANPLIYAFVTKDGSKSTFKTISTEAYNNDFGYGDTITSTYPLTATITREYFPSGSIKPDDEVTVRVIDDETLAYTSYTDAPKMKKKHIQALRNTFNYYTPLSRHYIFSSSTHPFSGSDLTNESIGWNKNKQTMNLISVPSIFYGSSIKKGTVDLRYYITGSLVGQLKDENQNGELIHVGPAGSAGSGSVAGVVLYNEGFVALTGSWHLSSSYAGPVREVYVTGSNITPGRASQTAPKWIYFGIGANDKSGSLNHPSASFYMAFSGTNYVPTVTMLAHAKKGQLNWSNNPTYVGFGQASGSVSGSSWYKERDNLSIKNTISSSYGCDFTGSFKKQTFINKIGIYDKDKNLIAIAKLSTPVRKLELDDYTFKLKLDF